MHTEISRTLEILDRLVAFPTVSDQSNLDLIDYVQDLLQSAGFDVTRIYSTTRSKAGLFARIGPGVEGGVCLSAHTDVVPVEGQNWTRPPFALSNDGDRVYGRGTTDMKGFLASALAMAERVRGDELQEPLSLAISYDEEVGCIGIREMIPKLSKLLGQPRVVIVGEPTSMQVASGHKGKTVLRAICSGEPGHSASAPRFVNAIHVAARFVEHIRSLQSELENAERDAGYDIPYSTVHIGRISGGRALNIVPDKVEIDMEFRHLPRVPPAQIETAIRKAAAQVQTAFPASHLLVEKVNAYPGLDTPQDSAGLAWMRDLTGCATEKKVGFGTEAGFFHEFGLSVVICGPGDMSADGHKHDEGLDLSQLAACDRMLKDIREKLLKS